MQKTLKSGNIYDMMYVYGPVYFEKRRGNREIPMG